MLARPLPRRFVLAALTCCVVFLGVPQPASACMPCTPTPTPTSALPTPTPVLLGTPTSTPTSAHPSPTPPPPATPTPTSPAPSVSPSPTATFPPDPTITSTQLAGTPSPIASVAAVSPTATTAAAPPTATPTAAPSATPVPTPSPAPGGNQGGRLVLNEVMTVPVSDAVSPAATESWIELFNPGAAVDGSGWRIAVSGLVRTLPLGTTIPSHGYLVLYKHETLFELSASPLVSLADPSGTPADSVKPPLLQAGQTFARVPDGSAWQISNAPTPGSPNALASPILAAEATPAGTPTRRARSRRTATPVGGEDADQPDAFELETGQRPSRRGRETFQSLAIAGVRGLPDGSAVVTTGIVTMPPGRFDIARGYIQADGAGILIHLGARSAALALGETARIKGRVHHYHGEVELAAVAGGVDTMGDGVEPMPLEETIAGVGAGTEALLVQVSGPVLARARGYVTLGKPGDGARVYLFRRLGLQASQFSVGQSVAVVGVVNRTPDSRGYRLLPRAPMDVAGGILPFGTPLSEAEISSDGGPPSDGVSAGAAEPTLPGERAATETPFATPVSSRREPPRTLLQPEEPRPAGALAVAAGAAPARPAPAGRLPRPGGIWTWAGLAGSTLAALGAVAWYLRRR
ncbi:MAG: lamin tail domain-containing protein [Chloroflexota bacterium]|nr:lamin tail domain-containing protein [Chloroflexota bacterium]